MPQAFTEELTWTTTEDGVLHDGVIIRPAATSRPLAVVWIHGFTGRFCEPFTIRIGRQLAVDGYTFVSGQNRGHDLGNRLSSPGGETRLGGGWWEKVSESPRDISAWISYAASLGHARIALIGHSYGALKVTWYQGEHQDPRVAGLGSASGPMRALSGGWPALPQTLEDAERLVGEGRGYELMPWGALGDPLSTMSAQTLIDAKRSLPDVYGVDSPTFPLSRIRCPILAILGTNEPSIGSAADLETIRQNARSTSRVDTALIDGADHLYTGREREVAAVISEWLARLE